MKIGEHRLLGGLDWRRESANERAVEWEMRDSTGYSFAPQTECFTFDLRFAIDEPLGGAYHRGFFYRILGGMLPRMACST